MNESAEGIQQCLGIKGIFMQGCGMGYAMDPTCFSCHGPKAGRACGICQHPQCKKCVQLVEKGSFALLDPLPPELSHRDYCAACYFEKVLPALESYEQTLQCAKAIFVFDKGQGQETSRMKRHKEPIQVSDCPDREEALLRLAFIAAKAGFNGLLDVQISVKKVRNFAYQNSVWQGKGFPAHVDGERLERESVPGKIFLTRTETYS